MPNKKNGLENNPELDKSTQWTITLPKHSSFTRYLLHLQPGTPYQDRFIGPNMTPEVPQESFEVRQRRWRRQMTKTIRAYEEGAERARNYDGPPIRYSLTA